AILPAADGHLWIGTASGLYLLDLANPRRSSARSSRPEVVLSSNISSLTALSDGRECIGSTGGIDVYRGVHRVRSLSARNGLPNRYVVGVAGDGAGRLWAATRLGVARYDQ